MAVVALPDGRLVPDHELRWSFARASGPGGQSVNTTDSAVRLSWDALDSRMLSPAQRELLRSRLGGRLQGGMLVVTAREHRSQLANRNAAAARMSALLATALAAGPARRVPTKPSTRKRQRRLEAKRRRGDVKRLRRRPGTDG